MKLFFHLFHYSVVFSENPSGSDITFALAFAQCIWTLNKKSHLHRVILSSTQEVKITPVARGPGQRDAGHTLFSTQGMSCTHHHFSQFSWLVYSCCKALAAWTKLWFKIPNIPPNPHQMSGQRRTWWFLWLIFDYLKAPTTPHPSPPPPLKLLMEN